MTKITGPVRVANPDWWACGKFRKSGRFDVRRLVQGRLLAQHEKRPDEQIAKATVSGR